MQTLVVSGTPESQGPGIHLHGPVWSPDGRYIQFTAGTAHGICD
jgi:Tol biopolymer transport system component